MFNSTFTISPKDAEKISAFQENTERERGSKNQGAIGGATTFMFTPTSLGLIFKVRHFDKELDLTDYSNM